VAGNGLRDVWILGEPVFRGMGLVFDVSICARAGRNLVLILW